MTTPTKKPTVAEAMAAVDELHKQVVKNQESLDSKLSHFDKEMQSTLEQWSKRSARDKEELVSDIEDLRKAVNKKQSELSGRIEEIGGVISTCRQTAEMSRETTLDIKRTVDSLQESLAGHVKKTDVPDLVAGAAITPDIAWQTLKKSAWFPWIRFALLFVLGLLAYHYLLVPLVSKNVAPNVLPNFLRPSIDPNSPMGAATVEVSREPFRSDTASREAFGRIFESLDQYVRSDQLTDFEGYYNEFGKRMQESIDGSKYNQWAELWRRLAVVCHRYGGGDNNLKVFNANLQAAARVVSGRMSDLPPIYRPQAGYDLPPAYGFGSASGDHPAPTGSPTAGTQATYSPQSWPFVQTHSNTQ